MGAKSGIYYTCMMQEIYVSVDLGKLILQPDYAHPAELIPYLQGILPGKPRYPLSYLTPRSTLARRTFSASGHGRGRAIPVGGAI